MGGMICLGVVQPQVEWQWWGGSARAEIGGWKWVTACSDNCVNSLVSLPVSWDGGDPRHDP